MTKKDYEIIASVFKKEYSFTAYLYMHENELIVVRQERGENLRLEKRRELWIELEKADRIVRDMAHAFKEQNPKFNWDKFMEACGMEKNDQGIYTYKALKRK